MLFMHKRSGFVTPETSITIFNITLISILNHSSIISFITKDRECTPKSMIACILQYTAFKDWDVIIRKICTDFCGGYNILPIYPPSVHSQCHSRIHSIHLHINHQLRKAAFVDITDGGTPYNAINTAVNTLRSAHGTLK